MHKIGELSLQAFKNNFLYSPITIEDFDRQYAYYLSSIDPRYVLIAERNEDLLGYIFAIPNYIDRSKKGLIIKTLARSSDADSKGLGTVLSGALIDLAKSDGYEYIINAYYHDLNVSSNISRKYKGVIFKNYELLSLNLI